MGNWIGCHRGGVAVCGALAVLVVVGVLLKLLGTNSVERHDSQEIVRPVLDREARPPLSRVELAARLPRVDRETAAREAEAEGAAPPTVSIPTPREVAEDYTRLRAEWNGLRSSARVRAASAAEREDRFREWRQRNQDQLEALEREFGFSFAEGDPAMLRPEIRLPDHPSIRSQVPASTSAPDVARAKVVAFLGERERIVAERAALDDEANGMSALERASVLERWEAENEQRLRDHRGLAADLGLANYEQLDHSPIP